MAEPSPTLVAPAQDTAPVSMREFLLYFLSLGTLGFGGPIALAGYMQRDLVERKRWISKQDYLEGLALAKLAPGPLAAQLAIYLGWVRARVLGATLASIAFIAPSLAMVFVIIPAPYYRRWARVPQIKSFVDGVTAAATGAIAGAAFVLGKRAIFDVPTAAIAAAALLVLVKARKVPEPVLMLAAGAAGLILSGGRVRWSVSCW